MTRGATHGLVLGKFMPPHLGHLLLVDFARRYADTVTVVVGTLAREPIPGELRYRWMRELFPSLNVVHLPDENPQHPHEHPDFWEIWRSSLQRVLPRKPDFVFASEAYGEPLARLFDAKFIPVNIDRSVVPVSGTAIRHDPMRYFDCLPRPVRPYFVKKVCLIGPESTGKSTLARELAVHYRTVFVPEYARTVLEHRVPALTHEIFSGIVRGQTALEYAAGFTANRLLFCDTDALLSQVWSEFLLGAVSREVEDASRAAHADLYLLLKPDLPWEHDSVRYLPDRGEEFYARCRELLEARGLHYRIVSGRGAQRRRCAIAAVEDLLAKSKTCSSIRDAEARYGGADVC